MRSKQLLPILYILCALTGALFFFTQSALALYAAANENGPSLQIAPTTVVSEGNQLTVPIAFASNGAAIAATVFSLDFDEACLALDPYDGNNDGRPDAIGLNIPPGLFASVSFNAADNDSEIDVIIADYFPPFATLSDLAALLAITFTAICVPPAGGELSAPLNFANDPQPSFGTTAGQSIEGTITGGTVTVVSSAPAPTPTPTITPTPTLIPTTPPGQSTTPTATPTLVPTAPPVTIVDSFVAETRSTGILLRWQTSQEVNTKHFAIRRLALGQDSAFVSLAGTVAGQGRQGGSYNLLDDQVDPNSEYSYLLVEEKQNGRSIYYDDLVILAGPLREPGQKLLIPLIMR